VSEHTAIESRSPADAADLIGRFEIADAADVASRIARAREAFPAWRDTPFEKRASVLRRFAELADAELEPLARLVAREVGKALWDARGEARLLAAKVAVTLNAGMQLVATHDVGGGARATYHPRGVLAVLAPFNFPLHLANGHIAPALATGNCVILKPSERAPACGERLVQLFHAAGVPEGVIQLVHGAAETGRHLATHADVDGVLFTGSYAAGRALKEATLDQPDKLLALEMGGSNAVIVLDDADLDQAVAETAISIAATTGQRCTSARRLFVQRGIEPEFSERLSRVLRGLVIGAPLDEGTFMGPLVSVAAAERARAAREAAVAAGGECILHVDPPLPAPYLGAGLVRWPTLSQAHAVQRDELFAPQAHVYAIDDLDAGIAGANDSEFGLAAAIFTRGRGAYEHCVGRIRVGCLNWNKGTVGASGKLPFGGRGRSGNDRPTGVSATLYCTTAQAHLESDASFDAEALPPGMPRP
jgi:succinylglutamic semialdehyde dehydrogenase